MQQSVEKGSCKKTEWQQRLARFAASGQRIKEFCQAEVVSKTAFYRWRTQLSEAGNAVAPDISFLDVGLLPPKRTMIAQEPSVPALEVRLDLGCGLILHIVRR